MEIVIFRFAIVWIILHILLFFIEWWRYKNNGFNSEWFFKNEMTALTYIILAIDILSIIFFVLGHLVYWILQPII